jgi:hypothetical protein
LVAGFYSAYQPLNSSEALQLERELGKVTPDRVREKAVRKLELSRIEAHGEALLEFASRAGLTRWLHANR